MTNTTWYPDTQIQLDWQGSSGGASTPTAGVPWLDGWKFRRKITINNSLSYGLSDYQVWIPTSAFGSNWSLIRSSAQSTMADFRFTPSTSTNTFPYWIEDNTTTPKGFWVRISTLPAGSNNIYMYYGNTSTGSVQNPNSTFIFYDDFNDGNYNGWTVESGSWDIYQGYLRGASDNIAIYTTDNVITSGPKLFLFRIKNHGYGSNNDQYHPQLIYQDSSNYLKVYMRTYSSADQRVEFIQCVGSENILHTNTSYNYYNEVGNWFWIKIIKDGYNGKFKIWKMGSTEPTSWNWEGTYNTSLIDSGRFRNYIALTDANGCGLDDIILRKYAPTEPTISSVGIEEGVFFSSGNYKSNVLDCGSKIVVSSISWNPTSQPAGTSIAVGIRVSSFPFSVNSSTPPFIAVSNGQTLNWAGRYIQYISTFTTNYSTSTPVLEDISIVYHVKPFMEKSITRSGVNSFGFGGGEFWEWQIPVKSGLPLTITAYIRYNTEYGGSATKPKLTLYGKGISPTSISATSAAENAWELLTINAGTPSENAMLKLKAEGFSTNHGAKFYIDDIKVNQ